MAGHARQQSYSQTQQRQQPEPKPRTSSTTTNGTANDPKSGSSVPKPKLRTSCDGCQEAKLGCSQEKPTCRRCMRHGTTCVYSPFRRIGRPRKSTNPRSGTAAKSRSKNDAVDEGLFASRLEYLPDADADADTQPGGITPFDTLIAPPSSPVSTDNGCDSWYPWPSNGNSSSSMNINTSANFMEGLDPFASAADYLELDSCFDTHHNMLMDYPMPTADEPAMDIRQMMQPTPPSSVDEEMNVFGEALTKSPTQSPVDIFSNHSVHQRRITKAPSSSGSNSAIKLETDFPELKALQSNSSHSLKGRTINPQSQRAKEELSDNLIFIPKAEPSPPLSAKSLPATPSSPCNKRCSTSLIQQLASLSKTLSDNAHPSLDVILQVERDTSSFCRRILTCTTCTDNKSNHLLFSMVVEQITRLFETISGVGTSERCSLLVGNFQVEDCSAKAEILRRLLLSRLTNFGSMLEEFSHMIDDDMTDYNTNAAQKMLTDVHQRLDLLKGIIERWD